MDRGAGRAGWARVGLGGDAVDDVTRDPRDDPMPYGVDTIRLRISFPTAPAPQGYDDRMWRMRPLRGWTGGQAATERPAGVELGESYMDGGAATHVASAAQQASAGSSLGATLDRLIAAMSAEAPAVEAQGGEGGLAAQRLGDAPPAAAQAGTPPQPSPVVEEHGRPWWWLHDHGLAQTKHEKADLLRKALGPGSGRLVVDENGVLIDVEQLSDDEVIALDKKLRAPPYGLPIVGPGAPVDETPRPGGESPKSNLPVNATGRLRQADPMPEASSPGARHYVGRVRLRTLSKEKNTVILRGESIQSDLEAIRAGRAMRDGPYYVVGDRYYIIHENGTIYSVQGSGFVTLDRGAFNALRIYNVHGRTPVAESILDKMGITLAQRRAAITAGAGQ